MAFWKDSPDAKSSRTSGYYSETTRPQSTFSDLARTLSAQSQFA
jgi:hypothetical protein